MLSVQLKLRTLLHVFAKVNWFHRILFIVLILIFPECLTLFENMKILLTKRQQQKQIEHNSLTNNESCIKAFLLA